MKRQPLYGMLAEFESPDALLEAARKTQAAGYKRMDAFTPMPVEGLAEAVGFHRTRLPLVVLIGGILGGILRIFHVLVRECDQLPLEYWRKAATIPGPCGFPSHLN